MWILCHKFELQRQFLYNQAIKMTEHSLDCVWLSFCLCVCVLVCVWVCFSACVCACVSAEMLMPLYQKCTPVYSGVCVSVSVCVCVLVCVCEACVSVFSHAFRPFIKRSKRCFRFFYVLHRAKVFFTLLLLLLLWASQDRKFNGKKSGKEIWQPGFYTIRLRPSSSSSSVCGVYYVETKWYN